MADVLIERLAAMEPGLTEDGVAARCGLKRRMYRLVKAGQFRFSNEALGNILRNFPGLEADVTDYLRGMAVEQPDAPVAA